MASENDNLINRPDAGFDPPLDVHLDALLRRHLKHRSTATVTDCAKFDPELVSAYVENALGATARLRFETHLSDCAQCRGHVVELFRLMPLLESSVASLPAAEGIVTTETVSKETESTLPVKPVRLVAAKETSRWLGWFDMSEWGMGKLAFAGTCAALVIAVAVPLLIWRNAANSAANSVVASRDDSPAAVITPPSSPGETTSLEKEKNATSSAPASAPSKAEPASQISTPTPISVKPQIVPGSGQPAAPAPPQAAMNLPPSPGAAGQSQASVRDEQRKGQNTSEPAGQNRADSTQQNAQNTIQSSGRDSDAVAMTAPAQQRQVPAGQAEELGRSVSAPEAKREKETAESRRNEDTKSAPPAASMAYKEQDREAKDKPAAKASPAPTERRRMTRQVSGKTFRFEQGIWIDESWNADDNWPVIRLTHDSENYDRVLAQIPALKNFFDLGQVTVLWQGKLYEVRKK